MTIHLIVNADLCDALGQRGDRLADYHRRVHELCAEEWPGAQVVVHSPSTEEDLKLRSSSVCDELGVLFVATGRLWHLCAEAQKWVLHSHDTIPAPPPDPDWLDTMWGAE